MMRLGLVFGACVLAAAPALALPGDKVEHVIVITLENHSFDNLFGNFPGAEGRVEAGENAVQKDREGEAFPFLPRVMDTRQEPPVIDERFPDHMPNAPFPIESYVPLGEPIGDLIHKFQQQQDQIHGGAMDRFAAVSNAGGLTMGYYEGEQLGLWAYAQRFTLADHFFHAAFGGSMLNHFWLVCACTPSFPHAPDDVVMHFDATGEMTKGGSVTEDGFAVNTLFPAATPHPAAMNGSAKLLPAQTLPTIADRLEAKGISWAWYAGGWNDAVAGKPHKLFQYHHQPFVYFKGFEEKSARRAAHLKDEKDLLAALKDGSLPAVSFYKPMGEFSMHPEYADLQTGDAHLITILKAVEASPVWHNTVVIVTFDENGGFWDHVAPPAGDRWGPGVRVPTIIISPLAKPHFVDHTVYDTTSILKFIETRWGLEPLGTRDAGAADLRNAFTP